MEDFSDSLSKGIQRTEESPTELLFHMLPKAFDGIELGTIGRLKHQDDILRQLKLFGAMGAGIVELNNVQGVGIALREILEINLKTVTIVMRELQKEAFPAQRLHRPIEIEGFKLPLHRC